MARDATETRVRILDAARAEVLERGFAATSVDDIQRAAGISRGTFFYHFPKKDDLARALIRRHADEDRLLIDDLMARAEKLVSDPLQQALVFIALHEELFEQGTSGVAGCLFASYTYEAGLFDTETHALISGAIEHWREVFGGKLAKAIERHEPRVSDVDPYMLADLGYGVMQGAFILWRTFREPSFMVTHTRQFRTYLELLFGVESVAEVPAVGASAARAS
jgi:AcrR family transcriptional regulator